MSHRKNENIAERYNRLAGRYDMVDRFIPAKWRKLATGMACGRVLEVGVGTGLNLPYYGQQCADIYGIDISSSMLEKAKARNGLCVVPAKFEVMDIQAIPLESDSIDSVVATFVFCTVSDPLRGLRECYRILKPNGKLILLEHMGSENKLLRLVMDCLNPFTTSLLGDHINRDTVKTVIRAGFIVERVEYLLGDVIKLIVAHK